MTCSGIRGASTCPQPRPVRPAAASACCMLPAGARCCATCRGRRNAGARASSSARPNTRCSMPVPAACGTLPSGLQVGRAPGAACSGRLALQSFRGRRTGPGARPCCWSPKAHQLGNHEERVAVLAEALAAGLRPVQQGARAPLQLPAPPPGIGAARMTPRAARWIGSLPPGRAAPHPRCACTPAPGPATAGSTGLPLETGSGCWPSTAPQQLDRASADSA